jgi:DNA-binding transcriptional LysR family regulator
MVKCFLNLSQTSSFTETARQTYMTQQAVSKYIAKLEDDLGFRLFVRTHHYVRMTQAGENYYALFSRFAQDFAEVTEETRRHYSALPDSLKIGYLEWLELSGVLSGGLKALKGERPDLRFIGEKYPQAELVDLFLARKLDLIITYMEFAPRVRGVLRRRVLDTPLVLLVSPENPRAAHDATVADFRSEPFIKAAASRETLSESRRRARRQCAELNFTPSEIHIAPNLESAYMATELGQGVLVSTMLSRMSLHSQLRSYPIGKTEELACFWHEDTENTAAARFAGLIADGAPAEYV